MVLLVCTVQNPNTVEIGKLAESLRNGRFRREDRKLVNRDMAERRMTYCYCSQGWEHRVADWTNMAVATSLEGTPDVVGGFRLGLTA